MYCYPPPPPPGNHPPILTIKCSHTLLLRVDPLSHLTTHHHVLCRDVTIGGQRSSWTVYGYGYTCLLCMLVSPPPLYIIRWTTHPREHHPYYKKIHTPIPKSFQSSRDVQMARTQHHHCISTATLLQPSDCMVGYRNGCQCSVLNSYLRMVRTPSTPTPKQTIISPSTAIPLRYPQSLLSCYTAGRTYARVMPEGAAVHMSDHCRFFWCTVLE